MIVGTAGHIDHGKTSLVRALTGIDADRLQEEKARGITIDLGFAYMPGPDGEAIGFVDVPGHERFIHNMLAGTTGIDYVLLAIAADDGVMPQTREHLAIVDLLGVERGIVALTKADLVDADRLEAARIEIANALIGTALAGADIIPVSSVTGLGVAQLSNRLHEAAHNRARLPADRPFRLAVDRCFTLQGTGTIVTGTVLAGQVAIGDQLVVGPSGLAVRVRGLHAQNRKAERGLVGDRCALNLAGDGVSKEAISRGDIVLDPSLHAPCNRIDALLKVLASETKPIAQWMPVRLHHATAEIGARIVLLGEGPIAPGTSDFVQLVLERPIAAAAHDAFIIRDTSARRTIGGGRLLDLRAPARKRRTPERMAQLRAHALADPEATLEALLGCEPQFLDLEVFTRDHGIAPARFEELAQRRGIVRLRSAAAAYAFAPTVWQRLKREIVSALESFHSENPDLAGIGKERLRLHTAPRLPAPGFAALLQELARSGTTALDGAWVKLPGHVVRLTAEDEALWSSIAPMITGAERFRPPRVRDIAGRLLADEADVRRLFKLLGRMGRVDEIDRDHFFLRRTVAEIVAVSRELAEQAADGQFTAAQLRDRLDNGRKVAIHILEFLDRHGVTIRRGDARRINRHRLDLFRPPAEDDKLGLNKNSGRDAFPVGRPDFKSGRGRETVLCGFDSHSLPPVHAKGSR